MIETDFIESREEMEEILREGVMGCLGLSQEGKPYVVPLNYGYLDGKIFFHCALEGKKLDYIKKTPNVCFTVARQSGEVRRHEGGDPCHVDNESVICYGTARIIEELEERKTALNIFNRCFRPDAKEITSEAAIKCAAVEIAISEMTGRREWAGKRTYWRYTF
jgi:nitroimidazol reductase NimA-like FMN-containing flavoprotein (pyridoxamine 5'-phosphate oxidase superfamily)